MDAQAGRVEAARDDTLPKLIDTNADSKEASSPMPFTINPSADRGEGWDLMVVVEGAASPTSSIDPNATAREEDLVVSTVTSTPIELEIINNDLDFENDVSYQYTVSLVRHATKSYSTKFLSRLQLFYQMLIDELEVICLFLDYLSKKGIKCDYRTVVGITDYIRTSFLLSNSCFEYSSDNRNPSSVRKKLRDIKRSFPQLKMFPDVLSLCKNKSLKQHEYVTGNSSVPYIFENLKLSKGISIRDAIKNLCYGKKITSTINFKSFRNEEEVKPKNRGDTKKDNPSKDLKASTRESLPKRKAAENVRYEDSDAPTKKPQPKKIVDAEFKEMGVQHSKKRDLFDEVLKVDLPPVTNSTYRKNGYICARSQFNASKVENMLLLAKKLDLEFISESVVGEKKEVCLLSLMYSHIL